MTEREAKTKITCHLTIGIRPLWHPVSGDPIQEGGPWNCGGSVCSAWRWDRQKERDGEGMTHDYCGLAGKP